MEQEKKKLRLDEILLKEGLISEEQTKEALKSQKAHGGKFGSLLQHHHYINEADLVKALANQFHCEGVVLSNHEIPDIVLQFIPSKIAIARKVVPFDYDPENNLLKVACENPNDASLVNEISFVASEKKVKLYIATELALNTVIARYYLGRDTSLGDNLLLEVSEAAMGAVRTPESAEDQLADEGASAADTKASILLVTDDAFAGPLVQSLLERDNYEVRITDSADDAIDMLGNNKFHTVFIKDTVAGDYLDLIDRLRKLSPRTVIRYYKSASSLLLEQDRLKVESNLLINNLELFTSLLSSKDESTFNHSGMVGKYVSKLCRRLGLSDKERLVIINAAYIHDLAKYYYRIDDPEDSRKTINLTAKLLQSLNYSPVVVEILRSMYIDLNQKYTKRLPVEILGGNILTMVDLFCDNISVNQRLSLDKFDAIEKKFHDLAGSLFLAEVVDVFIDMIKEEILQSQTQLTAGQIMILADKPDDSYAIELRLKNEGFPTISVSDTRSFIELYGRSRPDLILLVPGGEVAEVTDLVKYLSDQGIEFKKVPAFVMVHSAKISRLTRILEMGIEDIVAVDGNLDLLITKMHQIHARLQSPTVKQAESCENNGSATGQLADKTAGD